MIPTTFRRRLPSATAGRAISARRRLSPVAWILFAAGVAAQIAFPYTDGGTLVLTMVSVGCLAAAVVADAATTHGWKAALSVLFVAGGGGLLAESVGVHTGFPFGSYAYTGELGVEILDVPIVIPFAWVMMSWPALAVARRLVGPGHRWATAFVGACALTSWDVFLDPQMVDQGYWTWQYPRPALPGVEGIPLTNFAGWIVVSFLLIAALDRLIGSTPDLHSPDDALPVALYLWTYFSSMLAHAVFFGRPPVALVGGVLMGMVAIPLLVSVLRGRSVGGRRATS
ncbi:carotenoid biosynthesis protein [Gordonia sp. SID5947]|uniref:carotenoid biosynthesis protein n=1 Tax=Gordonia sp. SID5947 TaxID=2690315 RepID=UPI00136C0696|nr:carotenoid biosynthesis protein [Gordonia sp. SID5947]MYR07344.1 carotenoid biosynthesis protein [Gordonia sp. SID5947]